MGDATTLNYYRGKLSQSTPLEVVECSMEQDSLTRAAAWTTCGEITFRASIPPANIGEFLGAVDIKTWAADAAFGVVVGSDVADQQVGVIRAAAFRAGGGARFIRRFADGRPPLLDFSTNDVERQIIERLKKAFDPDGILTSLPWQTS